MTTTAAQPLVGFSRWMAERNIEYAKAEGTEVVVARLHAGGYHDVADAVEQAMSLDTRPIIELERNNAGRLFIGVTELDGRGYGVRAFVLSTQDEHTADSVMQRRFNDMVRLMGDNVQQRSTA